jgi:hypothetical protein
MREKHALLVRRDINFLTIISLSRHKRYATNASRTTPVYAPTINQPQIDEEALRKACFMVGTHVLDTEELWDQEQVTTYEEHGGIERGFRGSRKIHCFWHLQSQFQNQHGTSP